MTRAPWRNIFPSVSVLLFFSAKTSLRNFMLRVEYRIPIDHNERLRLNNTGDMVLYLKNSLLLSLNTTRVSRGSALTCNCNCCLWPDRRRSRGSCPSARCLYWAWMFAFQKAKDAIRCDFRWHSLDTHTLYFIHKAAVSRSWMKCDALPFSWDVLIHFMTMFNDWIKRSDCERWMYMSLSCSAYVKETFLATNYKMIPPSCQKHSRTRHAACNCTSVHCDNDGPMQPMSSHKSENPREVPLHCLRCTADYVFPTRPAYRFLTEVSHLTVTLHSCWGTHHLDSCTRTLLCEQRSASPRATDERRRRPWPRAPATSQAVWAWSRHLALPSMTQPIHHLLTN